MLVRFWFGPGNVNEPVASTFTPRFLYAEDKIVASADIAPCEGRAFWVRRFCARKPLRDSELWMRIRVV